MDPELWPQQPHPEPAGPHFDCEISQLAELRTVRHGLRTWLPGMYEDSDARASVLEHVLMVVDELISNGLRHGGAPVHVHAVRTAEGLLLDISDGDPHHGPEPAVNRDPALGGMGLHIVAHLTIDRGWTVIDGRKHVWARMSAG
jgi:anti-sigma regulatory factor (Ser/Thr protein kinase)